MSVLQTHWLTSCYLCCYFKAFYSFEFLCVCLHSSFYTCVSETFQAYVLIYSVSALFLAFYSNVYYYCEIILTHYLSVFIIYTDTKMKQSPLTFPTTFTLSLTVKVNLVLSLLSRNYIQCFLSKQLIFKLKIIFMYEKPKALH